MTEPAVVETPIAETPIVDNANNGGEKSTPEVPETPAVPETPPAPAELTDEQTLMAVRKLSGNNEITLEDAKKFFEPKPAEPTEAEKTEKERALEMKVVDRLTKTKKNETETYTAADYGVMQQIIKADPKELGKKEILEKLLAEGVPADEIEEVYNKKQSIFTEEELGAMTDKQRAAAEKAMALAEKSLENRGKRIQNQISNNISGLKKAIESEESEDHQIKEYAVHAAATIDALPKEQKFEQWTLDNLTFPAVTSKIDDTILAEAKTFFADPVAIEQHYFTDGKPNLERLLPAYLAEKNMQHAINSARVQTWTAATDQALANFSANPPKLGAGIKASDTTKKIVRVGEPQAAKFPVQTN